MSRNASVRTAMVAAASAALAVAIAIVTLAGCSATPPRFDGDTPASPGVSPSNRATGDLVGGFPPLLHATRMGPNYIRLPISSADLEQVINVHGNVLAALADSGAFTGQVYPVLSTDDGASWRIDGPQFWRAAADGAGATSRLTSTLDHTLVAWGRGGTLVKTSSDLGKHWYETNFGGGVRSVSVVRRRIAVRAIGYIGVDAPEPTRRYVSYDDGRTWHRGRALATIG